MTFLCNSSIVDSRIDINVPLTTRSYEYFLPDLPTHANPVLEPFEYLLNSFSMSSGSGAKISVLTEVVTLETFGDSSNVFLAFARLNTPQSKSLSMTLWYKFSIESSLNRIPKVVLL